MSNKQSSYPLHSLSMGRNRCNQIIKDSKAEIRRMESQRPSTPFIRKKIEAENYLQLSSRASSSSSIRSLRYESENDNTMSPRKSNVSCASKKQESNSKELKLEPIVTKSVLISRKNVSPRVKSRQQHTIVFPPIESEKRSPKDAEVPSKTEVLLQNLQNLNLDFHSTSSISPITLGESYNESSLIQSHGPEKEECSLELTQEMKQILFVLNKYLTTGKRINEEELVVLVSKLYFLLQDDKFFQKIDSIRTQILKVLFKLLDSNFPKLSLATIKILLEMKVKDKNLTNVYRLILKIINHNQVNLDTYDITDSLLQSIRELSPDQNRETMLYGIHVMKSLLYKSKHKREAIQKCVEILVHHLVQLNSMDLSSGQRGDDAYLEILKQIFIILHHFTEDGDVYETLACEKNLSEILKSHCFFYQNSDLVLLVVRLISKIVDGENGCEVLACCPDDLILSLPFLLQHHKFNIDIVLQTTFIINSLILVDDSVAFVLLNEFNLHQLLTGILEDYVKEHVQAKRAISPMFKLGQGDTSEHSNLKHNVFEAIFQILCILANLCLNSEAGCFLAEAGSVILRLLNIIGLYLNQDVSDAQSCIQHFLVVVGNIVYYLDTDSDAACTIAKRVIPLLADNFSIEIRLIAANIIHNLTRSAEVRKCILDYSLLPAFVQLLNDKDKELNTSAYGIIMNLLLDKNSHQIFYKEQGITKILHQLHLCTDRDWKKSSMLCQILVNFCQCITDEGAIPISKIEAQHLKKFLLYATKAEEIDENSDTYKTWKHEFCPVANHLLGLLQSTNSFLT